MSRNSAASGLEDHLGYWLRMASNQVSHAFKLAVEAQGATVAEWVVMRQLYEVERCAPSQLAAELGMTRGAISKLVERLLHKGFAVRDAADDDGRRQWIGLTAAGRRLVPKLAKLADENEDRFFSRLPTRERRALGATLQRLAEIHQWKSVPVD